MTIRAIRLLGDPVLRRKAEPVPVVDVEVRQLMDDLLETMYHAEGVGLAAPQVGVSRRVIVVDPREPEVAPLALANPELVEASEEMVRGEEGCLSIPGASELVDRHLGVVIEGLDREGVRRRIPAEGLLARILQHEVDHLDGVLFIDRISPLKRRMLLRRLDKQRKAGR